MEGSTRVDASDRAKRKMGPSAFTLKVAPRRPHPSVCRLESHAANVCLHPIPPLAPDEFSDRFVSKGVAWQPKWRETLSLSPMRDKQVISDACKGLTALAYIWVRSMYRRHFGKRFGNGFLGKRACSGRRSLDHVARRSRVGPQPIQFKAGRHALKQCRRISAHRQKGVLYTSRSRL